MSARPDLIGQRFGKVVVIGISDRGKHFRKWECRCDCGGTAFVTTTKLRNRHVRSCGCLRRQATHGAARTGDEFPEYWIWNAMRGRCGNPKNKGYPGYGGRGITVCERWSKFENFIADMGRRPSPDLSLERKDNNGNYEPGNCIWADWFVQARNKRRIGRRSNASKLALELCGEGG